MAEKTARRAKSAAKKAPPQGSTKKVTKKVTKKASKQSAKAQAAAEPQPPLVAAAEVHSIEARASVRDQIADDIARFLETGGAVEEVPKNFRADPPRRPENNYGRGSI